MTAVPSPNVRREFLDGPDPDQPSGCEDPDSVAHRLNLIEEMAREEYPRCRGLGQAPNEVDVLDDTDRVDGCRRLVEDQQLGST